MSSLVPRLSVQLFFARSKISGHFTTCEKKLDREPGNEATECLRQSQYINTGAEIWEGGGRGGDMGGGLESLTFQSRGAEPPTTPKQHHKLLLVLKSATCFNLDINTSLVSQRLEHQYHVHESKHQLLA